MIAEFSYHPIGDYYLAMNKEAARAGHILSKMRIRHSDMVTIRSMGLIPVDYETKEEIGKVKMDV